MMLKKKAMYILALLFLLIISISSVSAMGINSTDELISENSDLNEEYTVLNENSNEIDQINEINNENNDEVNINSIGENTFLNQNSQDSNSNILTDSQNITVNTKTFAAIQSAIDGANDGDTIVLSGTYSNNMYQPIKINKTLNFIGINNAILDANRYNNIFNVSVQISINDITFKNGKNNDRMYNTGGAISNRVQVTCINCTFVNNAAVSNGAVDFANAINCTFINNSATSGSVGAMVGTARGCIFINNSASENTGAIYLPSSAFLAVNCTFINNSAAKDGGAIFSYSNYNAIDCYFKNNSAQLGGAICANYLGIVNNCSFIGNNASVDGSSIYAKYTPNGPGTAGSFTISECKFINSSDNNLVSVHDASSFYLSNSQFIACNSSNNSNCFVVFDEKIGGTEIFNNSFVNCSFKSNGGILHLNYTFPQSINISGCTFEKISFNDNTGLFHSNRRNIYFDNCSFINLDLKDNVSIKLVEGSSPTNLINCYFKNNQVFNGTILDFNKYNFPFGDCYFINNTVKYGSLIFVGDDLSYLRNFNFENNTVYNYTLIDFKGSNCSLANCSFIENSAKDSGVLNFDNVSLCNLVDCYFEANNASNFGGAIYSKNSILNIEKCIFNDNYATNGGAICANGKNSMLNIKDCTFKDNEGAIFLEELSSSEFYNCSFINNTADKYGGAIYSILSNFTLEKCNLSINGARCPFSSGGGIIYPDVGGAIYSDESNFEINDCDFSANYAFLGYGGDVCVVGISNYSYINNSRFEGSSSDSHNGGIYGNCTINNSNFTAYCSEAIEFGVAINCLFERNYDSVIRNGVAKNCTFVNNDLASIFNSYKSDGVVLNSNITNCTFINNSAKNGGALAFTIENSYEVINCTFINNNATNGGAISIVNASVNIVNSSFENNTCTGSGAAVFIENATEVSIDHCEFVNCVFGDGGESIKTDDIESLNVSDCVFDIVPEMIPIHYSSILLANDFSFALGSNGILIANLSDVRGPLVGKTITLTVNGSDYFNITDSDGLTRFNMNDYFNSVGNYSAILSFSGDDSDSPVSTNVNIDICNYKGVLSVSSLGKYFEDVNISFRLYSLGSIKPISGANLHVMFSNGEFVDLVTGSDGSTSYVLPFAPGIYNLTAVVSDNFVDVNTAKLNNIVISPIEGKIDVTQAENVLNVRLYNPNNGDVYRNLNVTINFNDMDPIVIKTDDHGIASYDMSVLGFGTYSAIVMVTGDYKDFNAEILGSIIVKNYTIEKTNSQVSFGKAIVFDYGKTGSTTVAVVGGIIKVADITVDGHPEAVVNIVDKVIKVSGLKVGSYTLHVKTTPDDSHYSVTSTIGITVRKVSAALTASNHTVYSKENKKWSIKLMDTRAKKPLAKMQVVLKVYTGSKYKTVKLTTNSKGIITYKASTLSIGKHKVVISFSKYGHTCKNLVRYVTVKKRIKLTYTTKSEALKDGSNVFVWVKKGKSPINKIKIRMRVYTGSKYKEYNLTTGNYKSDGKVKKGFIGYGTNMLSVGKHKIVLKPCAYKYTGSKTVYMTIKKSAKKFKKSQVFVSNGKRSMNY